MDVILYCDSPEALQTNVCRQGCVPSDYWGALILSRVIVATGLFYVLMRTNPMHLTNSKVNLDLGFEYMNVLLRDPFCYFHCFPFSE